MCDLKTFREELLTKDYVNCNDKHSFFSILGVISSHNLFSDWVTLLSKKQKGKKYGVNIWSIRIRDLWPYKILTCLFPKQYTAQSKVAHSGGTEVCCYFAPKIWMLLKNVGRKSLKAEPRRKNNQYSRRVYQITNYRL